MIEQAHSLCINMAFVCAAGVGAVVVACGISRLVYGKRAVLKVEAKGPFSPSEVNWVCDESKGRIVARDGWSVTVGVTEKPMGRDFEWALQNGGRNSVFSACHLVAS